MRRRWLLPIAAVGVLAVAQQLLIPPIVEDRAEERLTEDGGTADVDVSAVPAARLLWKDGGEIRVRGGGYRLPLAGQGTNALDEVDGFDKVDISVSSFEVGPFEVERFALRRDDSDEQYEMRVSASASATDVSGFAGGELGGALGAFLGRLGAGVLPASGAPIPLDLVATIDSEGGRAKVAEVDASIAGLPAGPLAEVLAGVIAGRL